MAGQSDSVRPGRRDHVGGHSGGINLSHALGQALAWGMRRPRQCLVCANVTAAVVGIVLGWFT